MYTVHWCRYPHGHEEEAMENKYKEFDNLDKAIKFLLGRLHTIKSVNWAGGWIEDEQGKWVYVIDYCGEINNAE